MEDTEAEAMEIINAGPSTGSGAVKETSTQTDPPGTGNTDVNQPPATGQQPAAQTADQDKTPDSKTAAPTSKDAGNTDDKGSSPPTAEEISKALGLHNEAETLEHWKTRHAESSREAKEVTRKNQLLVKRLEEMGLEAMFDDNEANLVATEKFQSAVKVDPKKILDSLTKDEQELYIDEPEKYAALVVDKVIKATARPAPTKDRSEISISNSEQKAVIADASQAKDGEGNPKYPDFGFIQEWINPYLQQAPESFQKFALASKENFQFAVEVLYQSAAYKIQPILARAKDAAVQRTKKKEAAESDVSLASEGTTGPARQASDEDAERDAIVNAQRSW